MDLSWVREALETGSSIRGTCSFVGGSAARGWANPGSDVDVYILDCPYDAGETILGEPNGRPNIDVHALSEAKLDAIFERMSWDAIRAGSDFVNNVADFDWLLLERLHHAYVLTGQEVFTTVHQRLMESAHQHMAVQFHFALADAYAEDCLGQLRINDDDSAVISSQTAFLRALDGVLAAHGCFIRNPKWRSRAMQDTKPDLVTYDQFWNVVTMADLVPGEHAAWSRRQVEKARNLMARVDVLDFTRVTDA